MDIWSKEKRSEVMSKIRSKNTKPELLVRSLLFKVGYRFRIHRKDLPGRPDVVFVKYRTAVFINGCFWHYHKKCRDGRIPKSNVLFWQKKLERNVLNDRRNINLLRALGWKVLVIWECEIKKNPTNVLKKIVKFLIIKR